MVSGRPLLGGDDALHDTSLRSARAAPPGLRATGAPGDRAPYTLGNLLPRGRTPAGSRLHRPAGPVPGDRGVWHGVWAVPRSVPWPRGARLHDQPPPTL